MRKRFERVSRLKWLRAYIRDPSLYYVKSFGFSTEQSFHERSLINLPSTFFRRENVSWMASFVTIWLSLGLYVFLSLSLFLDVIKHRIINFYRRKNRMAKKLKVYINWRLILEVFAFLDLLEVKSYRKSHCIFWYFYSKKTNSPTWSKMHSYRNIVRGYFMYNTVRSSKSILSILSRFFFIQLNFFSYV